MVKSLSGLIGKRWISNYHEDTKMHKLIIIGAGPAGMTAGVYAARKGLAPLVISEDIGGQANWTKNVENYMGFTDIGGSELMDRFKEHMDAQRLTYEARRVKAIRRGENGVGFVIQCDDGREYQTRALIIATGKRPRMLHVPGEAEFRGKGVSYCATCDAPLFRNADTAVIGGGNSGAQAAYDLLQLGADVHLITNENITADRALVEKISAHPKLKIYEKHQVRRIDGGAMVEGITIADTSGTGGTGGADSTGGVGGPDATAATEIRLPVAGVFVEIGLEPNSQILGDISQLNDDREIRVDCQCRTGIDGLFAAGDVTDVYGKQIIIAASEGAKAALAASEYLLYKA
jgi:alkyl hydroperoxide reductase subunit F